MRIGPDRTIGPIGKSYRVHPRVLESDCPSSSSGKPTVWQTTAVGHDYRSMTTLSNQTNDHTLAAQRASDGGDAYSHHGSLRSKLVLSLAAIFLIFLTIDEVVRQQVIEPEFVALEEAGAIRDANRVLAAMNAEVEHVSDLAKQWASRIDEGDTTSPQSDPMFDIDQSRRWALQNLDWVALVARDGSWKWLRRGNQENSAMAAEIHDRFRSLDRMFNESESPTLSGMTRIGNHSMFTFAVVAVDAFDTTQDRLGGRFLLVCRKIDPTTVAALRRQTQVEFSLQSPRTSDPAHQLVVWEADKSTLVVEVQLTGINDEKLANVFVQVPRDITTRSSRITALARNSFIFGSVAALLMLLLMLQRIVIGPLTAIREHSDRVAEQGLAAEPLVLTGNDEIGQLAHAFDHMVNRLSDAQTQLTRASQATGRSQVASTVIHNVGNVLTNVNSLLDAASGRVDSLRIGPLNKLAARLKHADSDDGLLAATPDYLEGLAGSLKSDQEAISELLTTLDDNIRHIHDVIRDQQQHTDQMIKASPVKLKNMIDEAIACCRARLEQEAVSVKVSGPLLVSVHSDRSLLLQTMINIIGNARHAMRDNDKNSRTLNIDVETFQQTVQVTFHDNGCGMTEETIQKVFDAHFTTRESGSGLGLHFCAITLKRLGGSIRATSEGPGLGSTFVIELPRRDSASAVTPLTYSLPPTAIGAEA